MGGGDCQSLFMVTGVGCSSANFSLGTVGGGVLISCSLAIGGTIVISVGKIYEYVYRSTLKNSRCVFSF